MKYTPSIVLLALLSTGCGHKGPLYLPPAEPAAKPAAPAVTSKPSAEPATAPEPQQNPAEQGRY